MKLRFVQLEVPYDSWNEKLTQEVFNKTIALKINGYLTTYPYGILPFDATDFVANHLLICEESQSGSITPLVSYKSISLERCNIHNLVFPCLSILSASNAQLHYGYVNSLLDQFKMNPNAISYESGFTIHPKARMDRDLMKELKTLLMGFSMNHAQEKGIRCFLGMGMTKVKADQYFLSWGYKAFSDDNGELPLVKVKSHFWEESRLFKLENFSQLALESMLKSKSFWNNRILIESKSEGHQKVAA